MIVSQILAHDGLGMCHPISDIYRAPPRHRAQAWGGLEHRCSSCSTPIVSLQPKSGAATRNGRDEVRRRCEMVSPTHSIAWHRCSLMCVGGGGVVVSRLASLHTPRDRAAHHVVCVVHMMCTMRHDRFANLSPSSVGHVPPHFGYLQSAAVTHSTSLGRFGASV